MPTCPHAHMPTCPHAHMPTCPHAHMPTCPPTPTIMDEYEHAYTLYKVIKILFIYWIAFFNKQEQRLTISQILRSGAERDAEVRAREQEDKKKAREEELLKLKAQEEELQRQRQERKKQVNTSSILPFCYHEVLKFCAYHMTVFMHKYIGEAYFINYCPWCIL
jgi:hypothetical protein